MKNVYLRKAQQALQLNIFIKYFFILSLSEHRKLITWQFDNRGTDDGEVDFVRKLKQQLTMRYSSLVQHTEPTGMIVMPTRMDRVKVSFLNFLPPTYAVR